MCDRPDFMDDDCDIEGFPLDQVERRSEDSYWYHIESECVYTIRAGQPIDHYDMDMEMSVELTKEQYIQRGGQL